ncbi:hypothetical protein ABPG74_003701 [Tetrahymena malaccensis]
MSKQTIESYQIQVQKLVEENEDLALQLQQINEDINSKDEAIQKASLVIQMLREDLEKAVQDLQESENERDQFKKNWKEAQKQLSTLNTQRFKSEMEQQIRQFSSREKELQSKFEEERETNKLLQSQVDEMQQEIDMLSQKNKNNQKDLTHFKQQLKQFESNEAILKEKIEYKENQLTDKLSQITNLRQSITDLESHYQNEIQLLKKVIENQNKFKFTPINKTSANSASFVGDKSISGTPRKGKESLNETLDQSFANRNVYSQKKPVSKKRSISQSQLSHRKLNSQSMSNLHFDDKQQFSNTSHVNQKTIKSQLYKQDLDQNNNENQQEYKQMELKIKLLETELQDSLEREKQVIEQFDRMVANEAQRVLDYSKDVFDKEVAIRPEVERYLMMIEELKQKLEDQSYKAIQLSQLIKDSQIVQRLTMKTLIEQKIMFDVFIDKLEQHINNVEIEFITLTRDSRETIYLQSYSEIKQCLGRVRNEIIQFNSQKDKELQEIITQNSKDTVRQKNQGEYSQRTRVETLEKENLLVSEAYKQIKEILEDKGDFQPSWQDSDSTPQKMASFNANDSRGNTAGQNNNNVLYIRNTDSEQQITFEGRLSSQNQQTQGDQFFDFNLHQNLIRKIYSLQEKVKSYEKILDEKFALEKSERNKDDYLQRRLEELEEEKLFFQVEREKYLLEKDQLIQQIIQLEDQLVGQNFEYSGQLLSSSQRANLKAQNIGKNNLISSERNQNEQIARLIELENDNKILKETNTGLRIEIEQIVIDLKEQQEKIIKLEQENKQSLSLADQSLLDLDQAIKQNDIYHEEINQQKLVIDNLQKIIEDQKANLHNILNQRIYQNSEECQQLRQELGEKEQAIQTLKKKLDENESIMQDYCDIIAASRNKSEEDKNLNYKSQIENLLSLLTKSLEQYSVKQNFISKYKGFLEENYVVKMFVQKLQLFKEKISSTMRTVLQGYNKVNQVMFENSSFIQNNTNSTLSTSSRFQKNKSPRQIRADYIESKNNPDFEGKNYNNKNESSYKENQAFSSNCGSNYFSENAESLDDMEQQCQKFTGTIIENLIKKEAEQNLKIKVMKFCRVLNEIAEQLIVNANSRDEFIINKLQRLFEENQQKNVFIVEFQFSLMSILKTWKSGLLQQGEVFYQLSFYLKSLIEEKEFSQPISLNNSSKKLDMHQHIDTLSSNDFFNEVMDKIKLLDKRMAEDQKVQNSEQSQYKQYKHKIKQSFRQALEKFIDSIDFIKDKMLLLNNKHFSPLIVSDIYSNQLERNYVPLLEQLALIYKENQQFSHLNAFHAVLQIYQILIKDLKSINNNKATNNILSALDQISEICNSHLNQTNLFILPFINLINSFVNVITFS